MTLMDKFHDIFKKRRVRLPFLGILAFLLFLVIWRACSVVELHQKKYFLIARSSNLGPLSMAGKEPNLLAFEGDLINEIANEEKIRISLVTLNTTNLFEALNQDNYDGVLIATTPDSFMQQQFYISDPLFSGGPVLIVPEDSNVTSLSQLKNRGIGIESGSPLIFTLSQQDLLMVSYPNPIAALEDLDKGILAGVIMEAHLAYVYTEGFYKNKLKVATSPLTNLGLRIIAKDTKEGKYLTETVDEGLKKVVQNGVYEQLIKKWELIEP